MTSALYLAHLNPVTNAHVQIIDELKSQADSVHVMPVRFIKNSIEVNVRSFPFSFETRAKMIRSVFGDSVVISENYTFYAPFSKYLPPMLSPASWTLRGQILDGIEDDYFTYTGDRAEGYMLRMYRLKPKIGRRKQVSAASVKEQMYEAASGADTQWRDNIPEPVSEIIESEWHVIERFASEKDDTVRVLGMKFPKEGWKNTK